jgi:hypothetical protein
MVITECTPPCRPDRFRDYDGLMFYAKTDPPEILLSVKEPVWESPVNLKVADVLEHFVSHAIFIRIYDIDQAYTIARVISRTRRFGNIVLVTDNKYIVDFIKDIYPEILVAYKIPLKCTNLTEEEKSDMYIIPLSLYLTCPKIKHMPVFKIVEVKRHKQSVDDILRVAESLNIENVLIVT